jgi:hypothetical protein
MRLLRAASPAALSSVISGRHCDRHFRRPVEANREA